MHFPRPIVRLIDSFRLLPGVGPKTAQRLAFFILSLPEAEVQNMARALVEAKTRIKSCTICSNLTEEDTCDICRDPARDTSIICVVQEARDIASMERTGQFRGLYHVLQGVISPMEGIGPEDIKVDQLIQRLQNDEVKELILATGSNVEGEATSLYIAKLVKFLGVKATRIAHGLPVGGDLEYADELTLGKALEGRRELE